MKEFCTHEIVYELIERLILTNGGEFVCPQTLLALKKLIERELDNHKNVSR